MLIFLNYNLRAFSHILNDPQNTAFLVGFLFNSHLWFMIFALNVIVQNLQNFNVLSIWVDNNQLMNEMHIKKLHFGSHLKMQLLE